MKPHYYFYLSSIFLKCMWEVHVLKQSIMGVSVFRHVTSFERREPRVLGW